MVGHGGASFVTVSHIVPRASTSGRPSALESQLALLLRARDDLDEADREYLLDIVRATMRRIKADRRGV